MHGETQCGYAGENPSRLLEICQYIREKQIRLNVFRIGQVGGNNLNRFIRRRFFDLNREESKKITERSAYFCRFSECSLCARANTQKRLEHRQAQEHIVF